MRFYISRHIRWPYATYILKLRNPWKKYSISVCDVYIFNMFPFQDHLPFARNVWNYLVWKEEEGKKKNQFQHAHAWMHIRLGLLENILGCKVKRSDEPPRLSASWYLASQSVMMKFCLNVWCLLLFHSLEKECEWSLLHSLPLIKKREIV